MVILLTLLIGLLLIHLILCILAKGKYHLFIKEHTAHRVLSFLAPAALFIIDHLLILEKMSGTTEKIHQRILIIFGVKASSMGYTKMFVAYVISVMFFVLYFFLILALADQGNIAYLCFCIIFLCLTPLILIRELDKKIKKNRQFIIVELPEFINKLTLLINAGETVQQAIVRCVKQKKDQHHHPLYKELVKVTDDISTGYSFPVALDNLSKRCGMPEVAFFSTTVLMNYRRGGEEFVVALRELSRELWEKRKALTRTLGEEASAKLVFPMMIVFLVLMVIITTPAVLLMNE
ncbi:MAG TPA: type II secretion system F family protein [Bacilli bacterium]